ncbi:hypothetical protein EBH_0045830 [Eimeria brunetti]|uniref:Uncharacterized protein n=1 Tax=Eimeria brunetti TaxID=51314 RepID=U6LVY6_9EIME|nr:hypothetical protein EBH_0045830 [Eimeria brunetti]
MSSVLCPPADYLSRLVGGCCRSCTKCYPLTYLNDLQRRREQKLPACDQANRFMPDGAHAPSRANLFLNGSADSAAIGTVSVGAAATVAAAAGINMDVNRSEGIEEAVPSIRRCASMLQEVVAIAAVACCKLPP